VKKRTLITSLVILGAVIIVIIYAMASKDDVIKPLEAEVTKKIFEINVTVTGELQALRSTDIKAPVELRSHSFRFRSIKIQDLIPEGTVIDSGDYVATLDRSEADNNYKDVLDELEKIESQYNKTKLDTTLQLRQLRDELINLNFNKEEMEITLEQSQFEPPATIRQAQINLDKANRAYEQAMYNYQLKVEQAEADMTEVTIDLGRQERRKTEMENVLDKFVIHAPASGMLIYEREWSGQKRTVGSEISTWDLTVATLPDLSTMLSKTYVNEIDISKLKAGQQVRIGVDAFPDKEFQGIVTEVANIGEQLPNTDAKVFEIIIKLFETDPILRPSMTTSNAIIIDTFTNALCIPLEAVHSNDTMTYVYKKNNTKQVVVLDESNENEIIVEAGLKEGEKILLSVPEDADKMRFVGLELVEVIRQKDLEKLRLEEEEKENLRLQNEKMKQPGGRQGMPGVGSGSGAGSG
jgi:HlyD family secretion protein